MSSTFKRRIEDFICERCGEKVTGNGYTNHCPVCLWGKHVDMHPGDRANTCRGMMEPVGVLGGTGKWRIAHHCTRCGGERRVNAAPEDDFKKLLALAGRETKTE
ncbi:MAG: hypothetical protein G01um101472_539 [Parcubacteria group bacterium Gr01-1014_72]|jgi:hypothetical protein|nr:MAG: hypothetical protein G01um101472_539 [Parcubacteria group bacterium Gr01-1014_72]